MENTSLVSKAAAGTTNRVDAPSLVQALRGCLFAIGYIAITVGALVGLDRVVGFRLPKLVVFAWIFAGVYGGALAAVWIHVVRRDRLSLAMLGLRWPGRRLFHVLWQLPLILIASLAAEGAASTLFSGTNTSANSSVGTLVSGHVGAGTVVLVWALLALLAPFVEELVFRGLIFRAFDGRMPLLASAPAAAAIFAVAHVIPPLLPYVFVFGLGCCLLARFHHSLVPSMISHGANNTLVVVILLTL